jgi:hypothetical protein
MKDMQRLCVWGLSIGNEIAYEPFTRTARMVEAWAELHQHELQTAWDELQSGRTPDAIAPLI